jgi:hypothetical protein
LTDWTQLVYLGTFINLSKLLTFLFFSFLVRRLTALVAISAAVHRDISLSVDGILYSFATLHRPVLNHQIQLLLFLMLIDLTQLVLMRRYLKCLAADTFFKDTATRGTQTSHLRNLVTTPDAAVDLFFLTLLFYYLVPSEDVGIFQIEFVSREAIVDIYCLFLSLPQKI